MIAYAPPCIRTVAARHPSLEWETLAYTCYQLVRLFTCPSELTRYSTTGMYACCMYALCTLKYVFMCVLHTMYKPND